VANVAVEVLCSLVKGKTLEEATGLTEDPFYLFLGSHDEGLRRKVQGLLELLNEGIAGYQTQTGGKGPVMQDGEPQECKLSWDGRLST
jgi:hypothetical protein